MANCSAGECGICCIGPCGCIVEFGNPRNCSCFCEHGAVHPGTAKFAMDTNIDFCVDQMPLAVLAEFFHFVFPNRIAIPAAKVYTRVSMKIEKASCKDVLKRLDLIVLEKPTQQEVS